MLREMLSELPRTQQALKVQGPGSVELQDGCPLPRPAQDEILVRVVCVSINPFDWKSLDMSPSPGSTWGCDFSGEIMELGESVNRQKFCIRDRVAGISTGNNPADHVTGAFTEYAVVPEFMAFKIPGWMTFEEASTLPCGLITIGMSLHQTMNLPWPFAEKAMQGTYVLVYGGGTATGSLAIQTLRL